MVLVSVGELDADLLDHLAGFLGPSVARVCRVHGTELDPDFACVRPRSQYNSQALLVRLEDYAERPGDLVLGVTEVDLFSSVFTYVFGEARLGGPSGIFSIHRLKAAVYGLPEDPEQLRARARKEALHETGHLLGLVHCRQPECVMRFSTVAEEIDLKSDRFCTHCADVVGVAP
jgi:archaemetzincin